MAWRSHTLEANFKGMARLLHCVTHETGADKYNISQLRHQRPSATAYRYTSNNMCTPRGIYDYEHNLHMNFDLASSFSW